MVAAIVYVMKAISTSHVEKYLNSEYVLALIKCPVDASIVPIAFDNNRIAGAFI